MSEVRNDPVCHSSDRAIVGIVERQNPTRHAKLLHIMDVDEYVVQSMAGIDKDQPELPSFVAQPRQSTVRRCFYDSWWLATHSLVALLGLDASGNIRGLVVDAGYATPASHHRDGRKAATKAQIERVFARNPFRNFGEPFHLFLSDRSELVKLLHLMELDHHSLPMNRHPPPFLSRRTVPGLRQKASAIQSPVGMRTSLLSLSASWNCLGARSRVYFGR